MESQKQVPPDSLPLKALQNGFLGWLYQSVGWRDTDKHGRSRTGCRPRAHPGGLLKCELRTGGKPVRSSVFKTSDDGEVLFESR